MVLAHDINEGLRTQDVQITEDVTFDTMLLTPNTLEGLTNCGFYKPSPIQLHGIPLGKCGFDLLLEAKSGTGKTAVFTVIALEKLDLEKGLQTIILAPTREIAAQICDVITQIGSSFKDLNVEVVIGGLPVQEDIIKFKNKVHIVVGSPGRLRHLIQANHIDVSAVRLLVLDEADKLMDKTFQVDINYIFSVLPKEKQVILSSATYPEMLKSIMNKYVQNAQHMCPDSTTVLLGIKQFVITVKSNSNIVRQTQNRFDELIKILSKKNFKQCLIFCNYQVRVRDLSKMLLREKWHAEQLHGQQEQTDRLDALRTLQEYKCRILISTDLAARGIDASNVDLVVNFEPPYDWQTYLHRIGRAGRFGSYGIAVTIISEGQEELKFKNIIKAINSSLDLKNLWDEDKFDLDECDPSPVTLTDDMESGEAYNELLNKLTHGNKKDVEETESFEELCNSFKQTKESEIESFNDLLTCFQSHKIGDYDPSKPDTNTKTDKECFPTLKTQMNIIHKLNISNELEEDLIKLRDQIKLINENQNHKKELNRSDNICETGLKSKLNRTHLLKQDITVKDKICSFEFEVPDMNEALLDAGLPTSFRSSKYNTAKLKKIHFTSVNKNENKYISQESYNYRYEGTNRKNKQPSMERKLENKICFSEINADSSNIQIYPKELPATIKSRNYKGDNYNNQNKSCRIDSQTYELKIKCDIEKEYVKWYNQLKTHIKHVQMSLYIEELSKV